MDSRRLSLLYQRAHDRMRDVEGLLPQEAFDELLKFLSTRAVSKNRRKVFIYGMIRTVRRRGRFVRYSRRNLLAMHHGHTGSGIMELFIFPTKPC